MRKRNAKPAAAAPAPVTAKKGLAVNDRVAVKSGAQLGTVVKIAGGKAHVALDGSASGAQAFAFSELDRLA